MVKIFFLLIFNIMLLCQCSTYTTQDIFSSSEEKCLSEPIVVTEITETKPKRVLSFLPSTYIIYNPNEALKIRVPLELSSSQFKKIKRLKISMNNRITSLERKYKKIQNSLKTHLKVKKPVLNLISERISTLSKIRSDLEITYTLSSLTLKEIFSRKQINTYNKIIDFPNSKKNDSLLCHF